MFKEITNASVLSEKNIPLSTYVQYTFFPCLTMYPTCKVIKRDQSPIQGGPTLAKKDNVIIGPHIRR